MANPLSLIIGGARALIKAGGAGHTAAAIGGGTKVAVATKGIAATKAAVATTNAASAPKSIAIAGKCDASLKALHAGCGFSASMTGEVSDAVILGSEAIAAAGTVAIGAIVVHKVSQGSHPPAVTSP